MRVVLQQVDLDTCLTALLLGAGAAAEVTVARDGAAPAELADPAVTGTVSSSSLPIRGTAW